MHQKKELKPLHFHIDPKSSIPIYEQVKQGIILLIISGYLQEGDRLVPIRELATQLGINTNTIVKVYYQLDLEGYLYAQPGTGYFVKGCPAGKPDAMGELFQKITDEYLSKAIKLGYSLEDMLALLEQRRKAATGKEQP